MSDDKQKEEILPHDYDGIQELNNPLPRWWLLTFIGTIIFSVFYWSYYEIASGPSSDQILSESLEKIQTTKAVVQNNQTDMESELNERDLLANKEMMAKGKEHYDTKCAACHAPQGQGLIGPNLTDNYWMHSKGDIKSILKNIREGFPAKGMPAWGPMIPVKEQPYLAAYVRSLIGTNPPNPKAPQGDEVIQ